MVVVSDFPNIAETVSDTEIGQVGVGMYALVVAAIVLLVGAVFTIRMDAGSKIPSGVDKNEIALRAQQLTSTHGIKWKQAWNMAVDEAREGAIPEGMDTDAVSARASELTAKYGIDPEKARKMAIDEESQSQNDAD